MPNSAIQNLRQQLQAKFPQAHQTAAAKLRLAQPAPDFRNPGFFPQGGITEITPTAHISGLGLIIASLLENEPLPDRIPQLALIDGRDQFDPRSFHPNLCSRLLWLRCRTTDQSLKAADLLLRDGNLPRILLDLIGFSSAELSTIPYHAWNRFNQSIQTNDSTFIVLTPRPTVPCARLRLCMRSQLSLNTIDQSRQDLLQQFHLALPTHRQFAY